jgi:hypothetical protein
MPQAGRGMLAGLQPLVDGVLGLAGSGQMDAHWVDPTSRELLDLTLHRVSRTPVLVVVTFRPEFQHSWSGQPQVTVLALNRLGGDDGEALVELQLARGLSLFTAESYVRPGRPRPIPVPAS